ncbi:MAG: sec-independent protein translocase protein TatC [Gaiellales bacterium]|jgi:sec-independent protein translocase protein TatC|nr:sec-independent protein translocase protein TatC [Gaiellales bacterium]
MVKRARRVQPDEQLTLVEHLDELRTRIIVVLAVLTVSVSVCFWQSEGLLKFLAQPLPDRIEHRPGGVFLALSPLDGLMTSISIAIYGGLLLALPIATYQFYAFIIPAFSEHYHRHLRPLILLIPALFICGVVFGWYLVVPPALDFLYGFNADAFNQQPRAREYIQFVLLTLVAMGVVFEMPAVMLILARIGVVSSAMMRRHWRISIVALAVLAMLLPGVDPISYIVEFIPLLLLYGVSYFIVVAVERGRRSDEPDAEPLT